ncbi:MAG: MATE family efflux transporter [Clostridia bacterium]|nr:MATE family efflux transporter [Clostridia bacterium]NCC42131.1 MATE family efflux transporter [Clostridia bacterium]
MRDNITKQFAKYVSQNIFGMLGISCYIIADTFFISMAAGADGITVLNLALPIYNLIFAIGSMIGVGAATRYAISKVQNDDDSRYYFSNAVLWVGILSVLFIAAGAFFPDRVMMVMGADAQIIQLGKGYTRIFLLFTPFFMLNYIVSAFVRNDKAPSLAMIGTMVGSLSNIVLDYLFMFPMKMGLEGAALATAISPIISITICGSHFFCRTNNIKFVLCRPSFRLLKKSCQLGISACIGELSSGVTTTVFNYLILGLAGNIGVAAYGVVANFALVASSIYNGIAQGAQPLISRYYGKGEKAAVRKLLRLSICTGGVIFVGIYGVVYACTKPLVALFNSGASVLMAEYAFEGMRIYFAGFLFAGFNIIGAGYLSATDHPGEAFATSIVRGVIAIIGCSFLLSHLLGFLGVWLSFGVAEGITAVITICALRMVNKKQGQNRYKESYKSR